MKAYQSGIAGLQLLVITAAVVVLGMVVRPDHASSSITDHSHIDKETVAEALNFVNESKNKIARSFIENHALPRTVSEAEGMKPALTLKPEAVREIKFQHDYAGETVMIMAYLNDGVVDNILGGEQYVYLAGVRSEENPNLLEWQCGARNVDLNLLPADC